VHDILGDIHLSAAHLVENGLEKMRERDEVIEAEGACATLDGMNGAEDGMHRFYVAIGGPCGREVGHGAQPLAEAFEKIFAFLEERDAQLVETGHVRPPARGL
jgi:hypothetical protein